MYFKASFTFDPIVNYAPVNINFTNASFAGKPKDDGYTVLVDERGVEIKNLSVDITQLNTIIEIFEWNFGDGTLSVEFSPTKLYELSGQYNIKLSIYSQMFYDLDSSISYRVKNTSEQIINIGQTTYAWFLQHMIAPQKESVQNNQGFNDLIIASSTFFDHVYKNIHDILNLIDFSKIPAEYLQYWSDTLNHNRLYAKKIGYSEQATVGFLDYDFFARVNEGLVNPDEVKYFGQFLLDTARLFKKNGSQDAIQSFFKLYDFAISLKELWTRNFGVVFPQPLYDDFLFLRNLQDTKSNFKYSGINVGGWDNSLGTIERKINELQFDNYHYVTHLVYPSDEILPKDNCYTKFYVNDFVPKIEKIIRSDGRDITQLESCGDFKLDTVCTTGTTASSGMPCTETGITVVKNPLWDGAAAELYGVNYKIFNAPKGYVKSVINIFGYLPSGIDEIAENEPVGNPYDDYLWADWQYGVTVPPQITGVKGLNKPSWNGILPFVNYSSSLTNSNLFQLPGLPSTTNDFFIVSRGFIDIPVDAYYEFTLDIGNTGTLNSSEFVGLFSLQHTAPKTLNDLKYISSLNDIDFVRDNTDQVTTVGTTATGTFNLYSKVGEYGVVEIRQGEGSQTSGTYFLKAGYYAFEVKSTYSSNFFKKLNLQWEAFNIVEDETTIYFDKFILRQTIPASAYVTLKQNQNSIADTNGKGILMIPNSLIEGGDTIDVVYKQSNLEKNNVSGILNFSESWKNLDIGTRFSFEAISDGASNTISPQNSVQIVFRAISRKQDLYADVDNYYAFILDGKHSEYKLVNVSYSTELQQYFYRQLNLNPVLHERDKQMFTKMIIDDTGHTQQFVPNNYYEIKVSVNDNLVSAYFRENDKFKALKEDALITDYTPPEWTVLFENIHLDQQNNDTEIFDINGSIIPVADNYVWINEPGQYGFAVNSSVVNLSYYLVEPKDYVDETLVRTDEKWKKIKARYLDSRSDTVLKFNSYDENDPSTKSTFDYVVANQYVGATSYDISSLEGVDDNTVEKVYFNNVLVNDISSRFNIWLDDAFVAKEFKNDADLKDRVLIPLGHFYEPFVSWIPVDISGSYTKTNHASLNRIMSSGRRVLPHTVAISGNDISYPSHMSRTGDELSLGHIGQTLISAQNLSHFIGVWEEICPQSANDVWNIPTTTGVVTGANTVLNVIYRDKNTKAQKIGVKILSNDVITDLICRYCENTLIWGLYEITLPSYAVQNFKREWYWEPTEFTTIRYFIPIGKLAKDSVICLPSPEILRNDAVTINLLGVYAPHSYEGFTFNTDKTLIINEKNKWEIELKSRIVCDYFLDFNADLAYSVEEKIGATYGCEFNICPIKTKHPWKSREDCTINNVWKLPQKVINLINFIRDDETFNDEYPWWITKEVFVKENYETVYPDNSLSNLYSGSTDSNNNPVILLNKRDYEKSDYSIDLTWCVSSVGWDEEWSTANKNDYNIGTFSISAYDNIGFSTGQSISGQQIIEAGFFLENNLFVDTIAVSGTDQILVNFGLTGEIGDRTVSPYGLFNWHLTHSNAGDVITRDKAGWDLTDWNDEFVKCFKINYVYWKPSASVIEINKYLTFAGEVPPFGSTIYITVDPTKLSCTTDINRKVIGVSDGYNFIWNVPPLYEKYSFWYTSGINVLVDGWELPTDYYYVRTEIQ
jgi:hypothetical protein